ncbi:hypothetical protein GKA01_14140 [Gluconobacter kanchanaburiensis NBRC 103587]|uniref:Uncharacterized protein n=1 Tax=Gluconobacter kanchanaburiensis NBRC 103587 TaxID=1307948 RepID=A0A511BEI9_9PROT|nr:hypothetical protein AA103587_1254 [Gluconobacter kanchanaburiensis NBRC 103587]GEK96217.1 hypothetical protein GKA01_14140 [Gluconobacter kanchanaburiensis NBRC 103587]
MIERQVDQAIDDRQKDQDYDIYANTDQGVADTVLLPQGHGHERRDGQFRNLPDFTNQNCCGASCCHPDGITETPGSRIADKAPDAAKAQAGR